MVNSIAHTEQQRRCSPPAYWAEQCFKTFFTCCNRVHQPISRTDASSCPVRSCGVPQKTHGFVRCALTQLHGGVTAVWHCLV